MMNMFYDAYTGSITVSDAAWFVLKKVDPTADIVAVTAMAANFIDNIRLAWGGQATVGQILKMVPDFAMTLAGIIPQAKVLNLLSDAYSIANIF